MNAEKRLYRSDDDKMLAGVAGGLADYLSIDPTLVRLAFVLLCLVHGIGFLAYIVMWIVMPRASASEPAKGK